MSPLGDSPTRVRVLLLDDHDVVREGLRHLLESEGDIDVVAEARNGTEALARFDPGQVDVAVLDVRLPDMSGIEVCRELRARHGEVACLMLTSFSDDEALLDAVVAGAAGYVLKEVRGSDLVRDVRRAAAGESLLDPVVKLRAAERLQHGRPVDRLSPQERRILECIADGLTNRQIAEMLHLSEKTVKNYVSAVLAKLGLSRRTEAAVYAVRHGTGSPSA